MYWGAFLSGKGTEAPGQDQVKRSRAESWEFGRSLTQWIFSSLSELTFREEKSGTPGGQHTWVSLPPSSSKGTLATAPSREYRHL